jgi:hypothetical protein
MANWEVHRHIGYSPRTAAATVAILVSLWLLFNWGRDLNKPGLVLTSVILLISAAGSWALYEFVHHFHASLPSIVSRAMLGRLVNIHFVLAFPIMIGVFCYLRATVPVLLMLIAILAFKPSYTLFTLFFLVCLPVGLAINRAQANRRFIGTPYLIGNGMTIAFVAMAIIVAGISLIILEKNSSPLCSYEIPDKCYASSTLQKIRNLKWPGMAVASAGLALTVHRHGHKPVILGASGFDFPAYLPQTSKQVKDIIESVYGLDFHNPPPQFKNTGNLVSDMGRNYWSGMTSADWKLLARKFCIGAIIVPSSWTIRLMPALDVDGIRVYLINENPRQTAKCLLDICRAPLGKEAAF